MSLCTRTAALVTRPKGHEVFCQTREMRNWRSLTDVDFEELAADLLAAELQQAVERFGRGADGGVDLRWVEGKSGLGVAQCKHYLDSSFSQLRASAKREKPKIDKLNPSRYLFATSQILTRKQKFEIRDALAPWLESDKDVWSGTDLDQMLDHHKTVERKHVKLWLSTGTELFWATHPDLLHRSEALRNRVDRTIQKYVGSSAFEEASEILDRENVCLIAGQPGIGKTVLAHMMLADHMTRGFDVVEVSGDIAEAWASLDSKRPQIFFYDDFLGQLSFSERMGKNEDSRLSDFIDRLRASKSKRLVLTTREYILRDAARHYRQLNSSTQQGRYILELRDYSRNDKARILYNHLWGSGVSREDLLTLANGGWRQIVDHPNYSPRLVEYGVRLEATSASSTSWIDRFVGALDDPSRLWEQSFDSHLTENDRALLYVVASFGFSVELSAAQEAHRSLCNSMKLAVSPTDFRRSLDMLEGTFLRYEKDHRGSVVSFENPSIVDFVLNAIRREPEVQKLILRTATHFEQVERIWLQSSSTVTVSDQYSSSKRRKRVLDKSLKREFSKAVARTFSAKALKVRTNYYDSLPQSREERVEFILKLPQSWRPGDLWLNKVAKKLVGRWQLRKGDKARAFELIFSDRAKSSIFPAEAADVLSAWIKGGLEETRDWSILARLLEVEGEDEVADEYVDGFREHVHAELARWDPSPPDLEDLIFLNDSLGASDLEEDLHQAMRRDAEGDEESGREITGRQARFSALTHQERDESIERYFDHF